MAKKWMGILLALTLLLGGGLALPLVAQQGGEEVTEAEKPRLSTLIGSGIWWGKQESLERHTPQPDPQPQEEKI